MCVYVCVLLLPVVGSSMKMILGSPIVDIANDTLRFYPPDSVLIV